MRSQRRAPRTVTLVHVATVKSPIGDESTTEVLTVVPGALFDPGLSGRTGIGQLAAERSGNDQAAVLQPARWNLPGIFDADSDDLMIEGDATADGFDRDTATVWQVIGHAEVWLDRTKIPVERVSDV